MESMGPNNFGGFDGSGPFMGGTPGGPPPGDAIFGGAVLGAGGDDDDASLNDSANEAHGFLSVGLEFFEKMKKMKPDEK